MRQGLLVHFKMCTLATPTLRSNDTNACATWEPMTKTRPNLITDPTGMRRIDAASHCGVSPSHFDKLVRKGVMPSPRDLEGVKVWLRPELDNALFGLAPEDTAAGGLSSCDDAFGLSS